MVKSPPPRQETKRYRFDLCVRKIPWRRSWQLTSILAWRIPWTEEPERLESTGSQRVRHYWSYLTCTHTSIKLGEKNLVRYKWQNEMNIHWRPTTCHCSEICPHSCTHTYTHTQSHLSSCGSCLLQAPHFPLNLISHQGSPAWMFFLGKVPSAPTHTCKGLLKHFDSVVQFNKYQLNCYQVQWHRHVEDWVPCLKEPSVSSEKPVQFSSVAQSCPILCDPMNRSTPGLPVHYQLPEFTQTHVHWVGDAIQPSHLLLSPCPPAPNPFQHQGLLQWVNSSHQVAKVLEFQLQHQSFKWTPRTHLL